MSKAASAAGAKSSSSAGGDLWSSPWLYIGGAVAVGVSIGLTVWAYRNDKKQEKEDNEFRVVLKEVEETFDKSRDDILAHIAECKWNRLSASDLASVYSAFSALLDKDSRSRGILSRAAFDQLMRRLGVSDDMVVASLYRVWDQNGDGHLDFVEFCRNLNETVSGPLHARLQRYFRVYDLNGNGSLSRDELTRLFATFVPSVDAATRAQLVHSHFTAMDANADQRITFAEFESFCHDPLRGGAVDGVTFAQRLQFGFERQLLAAFGVHPPVPAGAGAAAAAAAAHKPK